MIRAVIRSSLLLLIANLLSGGLNYFYQLRGAALLPAEEYGRLNVWMAYVSLLLTVGAVAQIAGNFFPLSSRGLRRAGAGFGLISLMTLACSGWLLAHFPGPFATGALAILTGLGFFYLLGQAQVRMRFTLMGIALILTTGAKVAVTFLPQRLEAFYLAFPISYAAAACFLGLCGVLERDGPLKEEKRSREGIRNGLICAAVLALATNLIPQIDLLNLKLSQTDLILGLFTRSALFAKAIFFAAMTLIQVTLPYHLQSRKGEADLSQFARIRLLERLGLGACVAGSLVLTALAPWVSRRFLGYDLGPYQLWVLLSCLSLTALYGQLQTIQIFSAFGDWRRALTRILLLSLSLPLCAWLKPANVSLYLSLAMSYSLTLTVWDFWRLRSPFGAPAAVTGPM
jgi:O-antigen/teichoic acid export membrane protein